MNRQEILKGKVIKACPSENGKMYLVVKHRKENYIILSEDVELDREWKSLVPFIGREISFVPTQVIDGKKYASRKKAQEIIKPLLLEKLKRGEIFKAKIINKLNYGVYVEIDEIPGLLKDIDFSDEFIKIMDVYNIGDTIDVKMKRLSQNEHIVFEAVEKQYSKATETLKDLEVGQYVIGNVSSVKPWGVYVRVGLGVDALGAAPLRGELETGSPVLFNIRKIENGKVRGKIIRVLSS